MPEPELLPNLIAGERRLPAQAVMVAVTNPATGEVIARVPLSGPDEVEDAVRAARRAFAEWRNVPAGDRVQYLFRFRQELDAHRAELARLIVEECGKTIAEALGELRRGIENVEMACGIPSLLQGWNNEDISAGVDEHLFRQPLGVVAAITPFNFPAMIPLWFLPYAIACGNCFLLKPSEKTPLTAARLLELLAAAGLPPGVAQLVHGGQRVVEAIVDHPDVAAVSFVGSTAAARAVYARAAAAGKRAQCQGGAKNPVVVLPDADFETATPIIADSAFGCAGQRCLAASLAITVGDCSPFTEAIVQAAAARRVGRGGAEGVEMGPVISRGSQERITETIARGRAAGARVRVEGAGRSVPGCEEGYFVFPTVLEDVASVPEIARQEVFGPVLGLIHVDTLDEALRFVNEGRYGNMACLFTSSGAAARRFRREVIAGNVGINVGVAAPLACFPFSGWKESFFGDLHAQGRHSVEFYTQTKVVVERWPREMTRLF